MNSEKNGLSELNFENKDDSLKFYRLIQKEYINSLYRVSFQIIIVFVIYFIYYNPPISFLIPDIRIFLDQIVGWILISIYLIIHFFKLTSFKFCPTLVNFLKNELNNLDFEMQKKYKTGFGFFLFNGFTVLIFLLISPEVYLFNFSINYFITSLIIRLFIFYIFLSITIPIIRGVLHDRYLVKLKNNYFVQLNLKIKLIKHIEAETQMIGIYMSSNKLGLKSEQYGYNIYKKISEKRWLPKRGKNVFSATHFSSYLQFHEYSTPINFKEHFLNIVSAIKEWDMLYKKKNNKTENHSKR